jgi:hypothetical protein
MEGCWVASNERRDEWDSIKQRPFFLTVTPNSNQYKMILNVASVLPISYFSILREGVRVHVKESPLTAHRQGLDPLHAAADVLTPLTSTSGSSFQPKPTYLTERSSKLET